MEFIDAVDRWVEAYNLGYLHSTLGDQTPAAFEQHHARYRTQFRKA